MVAGKTYSVKATLKPEYAGNFEFVDASGVVLPDASVSTSQEFDYSGAGNGNNPNFDIEEFEKRQQEQYAWYRKLLTIMVAVVSAMTVIMAFIVILVAVLIRQVKKSRSVKKNSVDESKEE